MIKEVEEDVPQFIIGELSVARKKFFSSAKKFDCEMWMKSHQKEFHNELKLIPPNY